MKVFLLSLCRGKDKADLREKGAITLAETLIVLSIGIAVVLVWTQNQLSQMEVENARNAGRAIATYARAAATWLAQSPPTANGTYTVASLQDCNNQGGEQFLSCTFGPATPISYVRTAAGGPATFGDLEIDVSITPTGTLGVIDFGVFRSGADGNGDGQPDARPDLAAAAFQTATEQTGAGVFDFFELSFVEPDPAAVIFDSSDPNFDQTAIDNLARLQARVGAQASGDTPFLRIDGTNEMTGALNFENGMQVDMDTNGLIVQGPGDVGIQTDTGELVVNGQIMAGALTFENGMQIDMDTNGLIVQGPGDVGIQTDTGGLVVNGQINANALQTSSAEIDQLRVEPATGVSGEGFERLNQAPDIVRIDQSIGALSSRVTVNERDIRNNTSAINSNRQDIQKKSPDLVDLIGKVDTNALAIAANRGKIDNNSSVVQEITSQTYPWPCRPTEREAYHVRRDALIMCTLSHFCENCGKAHSDFTQHEYKARNLSTLACESRYLTIHTNCCFEFTGPQSCSTRCIERLAEKSLPNCS